MNRLLNFPYIGTAYIKPFLCIAHYIIVIFLLLVALIVWIIAPFAILFTGSYPAGMHSFSVGVGRWFARVNGYVYALTDRYPPFSME